MAVRPVEFQGMIQNTHEPALQRKEEQQRPLNQQMQAAQENTRQTELSRTQISGSEESERDKFDPERGGDGTGYAGNRGKKKEDKEKEKEKKGPIGDGVVRIKNKPGSFSVSI